jgi:hypothetical protein
VTHDTAAAAGKEVEKKPAVVVAVSAGGDWNDDPVSSDDDDGGAAPKLSDSHPAKRIPDLNRAGEVDAEAQTNPTSMFQKKPEMGALMGRNIALELRVPHTHTPHTHTRDRALMIEWCGVVVGGWVVVAQAKKETGLIALKKVEADEGKRKQQQQSAQSAAITEKVQLRKVERPSAAPKKEASSVPPPTRPLVVLRWACAAMRVRWRVRCD